jgi:hypothetical protein
MESIGGTIYSIDLQLRPGLPVMFVFVRCGPVRVACHHPPHAVPRFMIALPTQQAV